jgi:NAD(P)-dependent dehydrogenase (short-subunit alcohol dehydrogenase family)
MANKTWFITGTSRGFGREWTKAALERGDRVAATARDPSTLDDLKAEHGDALLPLTLDVTSREAAFGAVKRAHEHFGRLDIVVNNAGYGHFGMVEEISEREARAQIETNLFGALWVTQAALPFLREQGSQLVHRHAKSHAILIPGCVRSATRRRLRQGRSGPCAVPNR